MQTQEWNPGGLLQTSGNYWLACTLHAAVKLKVFTALGGRALTGPEVARELGADARAMGMLLDALTAAGLLSKTEGKYGNTEVSRSFLSEDSPQYLGHMILHHHYLVESWSRLDEAIRTGKPVRTRSSIEDEGRRESFLMGMFNNAMQQAPQVVKAIDLSGRHHLLDFGGGPGTYAIHFCREYPELKATVFDLATTRPFAAEVIAQFGMEDRISFVAGDYLRDEPAGAYDAAWLSHVLHAEGPDGCETIVRKAVSVLEPGGVILVQDFILNDTRDGPPFPALFSLNMLLGTEGGQSYSGTEIMGMLERAGVKELRRLPFEGLTGSGIISGVV